MKTKAELLAKRAEILSLAEAMKGADGSFKDDTTRAAFDAKMAEIENLDAQVRALPPETAPDAVTAERERITGIQSAVRTAKLDEAFGANLVERGVKLDEARKLVLDELARKSAADATGTRTHIAMGEDARDKFLRGAVNWLLIRSGKAEMVAKSEGITADKIDAGEFRGMSLLRLAEEVLSRSGVAVRGLSNMEMAGQAMALRSNYQGTGDFATALENAMHKVLRAAYTTQADTWSAVCGVASNSDFRAHNWYRMGNLSVLDAMNENGEFKNKSIPDAEKATMTLATKGNIIGISRQTIVNDDIGFVMRLTEMLGRAGKLTIEKAFYTSLNLNSGLGPTQTNSQPLFHSSRSNVNSSATAITVAGIEADRAIMRSQMDPNSQDYLDLQPSVLLVPVAKRGDALTINDAQFDPADSKFQKPNTVRGLFSRVIDTPRITGNRRYLFADPSIAPVWVVSFLDGQREPVLETENGWRTDGVEMKARLDFGLDVVDYRGAVTNAGA